MVIEVASHKRYLVHCTKVLASAAEAVYAEGMKRSATVFERRSTLLGACRVSAALAIELRSFAC